MLPEEEERNATFTLADDEYNMSLMYVYGNGTEGVYEFYEVSV